MIVRKVDGVYRGTGRCYGKPDVEIVRGDKRWDVYELCGNSDRVLIASNVSFVEARFGNDDGYVQPAPQPRPRITRVREGFHEFGPVSAEKVRNSWRVYCGDAELGVGLQFLQAKKLASIEEKKFQLSQFRLAMSFVPRPCRNINLHRILSPAKWRKLAKEAILKAKGQCEICGSSYPRLDCHEVWTYNDLRHIQKLERLMALCFLCHRAIHFNTSYLLTETAWNSVVSHFQRVNQVDSSVMSEHEKAAEWLYNIRDESVGPWTVDFGDWSELAAHGQPHDSREA